MGPRRRRHERQQRHEPGHRPGAGRKPPRDLVLAFVADEEAGGVLGARWLVDNRPDLFEGCTEAISEVGGFSYTLRDDLRLYLVETAQKGMAWMRLTATGRAGHGSFVPEDNAVTRLCQAVAQLGTHQFPIQLTPTVRTFLDAVSESTGVAFDPADPEGVVARLGSLARLVGATLRNTANPTQLDAGYKVNVVPGQATASVDGRFLPGHEEEFDRDLDQAIEEPFEGPLVDGMAAALRAEDPGARAVPYMLAGGTDAKSFSRLGIRCYGFSPLRLPPELDFTAMFHGVDERVPVEGLRFGVRVLDRFLAGV